MEIIRNKWRHGLTRFEVPRLGLLDYSDGILPFTSILDEEVGPEVVLILTDHTEFIDVLKTVKPFTLMMKAGWGER